MEHLLSSCRCSFVVVATHSVCLSPPHTHSHSTTEQWHGIEMNERTQKSFINTAEMRRRGDEWARWMATGGEVLEDTRDSANAEKGEHRKNHPRSSLTRCIHTYNPFNSLWTDVKINILLWFFFVLVIVYRHFRTREAISHVSLDACIFCLCIIRSKCKYDNALPSLK